MLYKEHFLGWAPDTLPTPGAAADRDNDGVFLTVAQDNTTVFVDLNNDGTVDQTYTLNRLQTQYVSDPNDGDLSGAHFWATGPFTMAYGENPDTAQPSTPPWTSATWRSRHRLHLPRPDRGQVGEPAGGAHRRGLGRDVHDQGELAEVHGGRGQRHRLPAARAGSTSWDGHDDHHPSGQDHVSPARPPNPAGAGSLTTLAWSSAQLGGNMAENQEITITFTARTTAVLAVGNPEPEPREGRRHADGRQPGVTQTFTATDFAFVTSGNVGHREDLECPCDAAHPLYPGDTVTYTTR